MNHFPLLFSPIDIGPLRLQNRIIMPAMHLSYAENGFINERLVDFYKERAKNEIGLIIVGGCYIDILGKGVDSMIAIDDDKYIDGLKQFATAIHDCSSTKVAVQLYHSGRYSFEQLIGAQPISSSVKYSTFSKSTPRALKTEEVPKVVQQYADAAVRAKKAGLDAVEIVGSAGYLIDQFMSPLINERADEYGGSFEKRLRFPKEVIESCKNALGEHIPLIMRYSGSDLVPGSNTLEDKVKIAPYLESAGLDALNVTGGWHESKVPSITMNVPPGAFSYFSREIKKAVSIPVFSSNRINDPSLAEHIIHEHRADAVCIGRGLISDPEFPTKAREGRASEIRKCVGCNQGCFDAVFTLSPVTCMRNPEAGNESKFSIEPADQKKKVLIVGAGVAGLECARVCALEGHAVSIYEKQDRIGGQAWLAASPPGREDLTEIIEWYDRELERLHVPIHLGEEIGAKEIINLNPDVVVLATGAKPVMPPIPGIDLPGIHFAWDFLDPEKRIFPGDKCAVIGGGATGVEVALRLSEFGAIEPEIAKFMHYFKILDDKKAWDITGVQRSVYILEMLPKLGLNFGKSTRWVMLQDLEFNGVKALTGIKITQIDKSSSGKLKIYYHAADGATDVLGDLDTIFVATSIESENDLEIELKSRLKVRVIGDAKKPKDLMKAIHDGYKAARRI